MTQTYRSFAKINLHLQVLGRRDDGYHEIQTILQEIELADEIQLEFLNADPDAGQESTLPIQLQITGFPIPGDSRQNLVLKAVNFFYEKSTIKPEINQIQIQKNIPPGGGLAGGSSNAVYTLLELKHDFLSIKK